MPCSVIELRSVTEPPVTELPSVSESTVRRLARQEGYFVRKSRAQNWRPGDFGGYMLCDAYSGFSVMGFEYDADLPTIYKWLKSS